MTDYVPGSQLSKWFPNGTIPAWQASIPKDIPKPEVLVPSTVSDILAEIRGGDTGGLGAPETGAMPGRASELYGGRGLGFAGTMVGGPLGGLAGNAIGTAMDRNSAAATLEALGIDSNALGGSFLGNMAANTSLGGLLGLGSSTYDNMDTAARNALAQDAFGALTAQNAPLGAAYQAAMEQAMANQAAQTAAGIAGAFDAAPAGEGYSGQGDQGGAGGFGGDIGGGTGVAGAEGRYAMGGMIGMGYAEGGEIPEGSFVIPADVTGAFGNGDTRAGARQLSHLGAHLVTGPGDGRSDSIALRGPGGREIRVSSGELIIPPDGVERAGGHEELRKKVVEKRKSFRRKMGAFGAPSK